MTVSRRVRVSIDASAVPARPAGAGRYVVELVTALAPRPDVDLVVVCRRDDGARWRTLAATAGVVDVAPGPRPLRLIWEQARLGRVVGEQAAEVHHGPHYTMPERSKLPRVVTIHDLTFFDHPEWHERTKAFFFRRAIRVAAGRADALICVSQVTAARLEAVLSPVAPIHVIGHGVDHSRFHPLDPALPGAGAADQRVLDRLGVRSPYVAFVGTIEPRKDVGSLIAAFDGLAASMPELSLVLAGGDGWGVDIERAMSASAHRDRITRLGYVAADDVAPLLRGAQVVAYPSLAEGFGLPALEAMACGTPLMTTAGTAMEEVAAGAALLVAPGDVAALATGIEACVSGGEEIERRRRRGIEVAAAATWDASAEAHAAVYRGLV